MLRRYDFGRVKFGFATNAIIDTKTPPTIASVYYRLTLLGCRHVKAPALRFRSHEIRLRKERNNQYQKPAYNSFGLLRINMT